MLKTTMAEYLIICVIAATVRRLGPFACNYFSK